MRDKINVFYYPEFWVDGITLMKAILLFDEIHFMDRPSLMFGQGGSGQFGTIGAPSPLREYEVSFRKEGVPLFVHPAPMGPIRNDSYDQIKADVNDLEFLRRFQRGLKTSATFRGHVIAVGDYGEFGDQDDVAQKLIDVDLAADLTSHETPIALFEDSGSRPFHPSAGGIAKTLIAKAVICSARLNFALVVGTKEGFIPLADGDPYGHLLGAKYARAISKLEPAVNKIQLTDLSFAVFDELVPRERLQRLNLADAIKYRKASEKPREEFLEHLTILQTRQSAIGLDGDYAGAIATLINTEIKPAARTFKNKLQTIYESLFGAVAKGAIGAVGGSSAMTVFGDLSWPKVMGLAGTAAAYVAKATIDAILAERAAKRECSISYLLSLDE